MLKFFIVKTSTSAYSEHQIRHNQDTNLIILKTPNLAYSEHQTPAYSCTQYRIWSDFPPNRDFHISSPRNPSICFESRLCVNVTKTDHTQNSLMANSTPNWNIISKHLNLDIHQTSVIHFKTFNARDNIHIPEFV